LREFDDADLAEVHALVSDDRVTTWLSFDAKTPEQTAELLGGILERQAARPRSEYYLAIGAAARRGEILGFVRLGLGGVRAADLGYAVRPEFQRQGVARAAATAMLDFSFHQLGLHRVTANIGPTNAASIRLVRSLGFTREGTIRDHVYTDGAWRDSDSYSLLEHEWRSSAER
ncbi:MAG: GNAT family N-acetyltransferase, partial [Nocardioides sp.]